MTISSLEISNHEYIFIVSNGYGIDVYQSSSKLQKKLSFAYYNFAETAIFTLLFIHEKWLHNTYIFSHSTDKNSSFGKYKLNHFS